MRRSSTIRFIYHPTRNTHDAHGLRPSIGAHPVASFSPTLREEMRKLVLLDAQLYIAASKRFWGDWQRRGIGKKLTQPSVVV